MSYSSSDATWKECSRRGAQVGAEKSFSNTKREKRSPQFSLSLCVFTQSVFRDFYSLAAAFHKAKSKHERSQKNTWRFDTLVSRTCVCLGLGLASNPRLLAGVRKRNNFFVSQVRYGLDNHAM